MDRLSQTFNNNAQIMKSKVTTHAIYGVTIAVLSIIAATLLASYFQFGKVTLATIIDVQKTNVTLWFLDAMPFIFAFWGQYTSHIMAYEASSMVMDQTAELRDQTVVLEHKAAHDATHDKVTNLPNRILLMDRLEQAIKTGLRQQTTLALLIFNITNFKEIKDTLGYFNSDRLLQQIVLRLEGATRKSDTLSRIDGKEFAILLPVIQKNEDLVLFIEKILNTFIEPFSIDKLTFEIQTSIGAAIFPEHGNDTDTLMQRANVALFAAKQKNKQYIIYSSNLDKNSPHRLTMMGELRQAITNDDLVLYYQPKIDLHTRRISGVEALVRWQHPEHGFLPPDEFIPMAERTGLIRLLSIWVLKKALSQAEMLHKKNIKLSIAINLSPSTFLDSDLPDLIIGMLSLYKVPAEYIILEITESSMIKDPDLAMEILNRLTKRGLKISIDDFGTGYSSLAYLKKLPVSEIKIDKSFVTDMLKSDNDAVIVKSIIDLGHNLSLNVVAEGVEDKETVESLKSLGCDVLQGFYFSEPLSSKDFLEWLPKKK